MAVKMKRDSYLVCTYDIDTIVVVVGVVTVVVIAVVVLFLVSAGSPALMSCLASFYVDE